MPARKKSQMISDDHKAALAEGRSQGRAVRTSLEALDATKPRRGRSRSPETIEKRLASIDEGYESADPSRSFRWSRNGSTSSNAWLPACRGPTQRRFAGDLDVVGADLDRQTDS